MATSDLADKIAFLNGLDISRDNPAALVVDFALRAKRADLFTSKQLLGAKLKLIDSNGVELLNQLVEEDEQEAPAPAPA
ncbi:hypothetical protein, partial [Delftia sp. K82]|uniref:hypothetical protein n=1 Tax=Delftia sp. K82 TaxID=1472718 RepID=UPI0015C67752